MKQHIVTTILFIILLLCSCRHSASQRAITAQMALEGVTNYCHSEYDWSVATDDPSIMYVKMEDETPSEYHVVFRSYTGAYVFFYVDKSSGNTRMVETVPALNVKQETGTINLIDYIDVP